MSFFGSRYTSQNLLDKYVSSCGKVPSGLLSTEADDEPPLEELELEDLEDGEDEDPVGGVQEKASDDQCFDLISQLKAREVADNSVGWQEIEMSQPDLSPMDADPAAAQRLGSNQRPELDSETWRSVEVPEVDASKPKQLHDPPGAKPKD